MNVKCKLEELSKRISNRLEDGLERIISSSILATMENKIVGGSFMPRGYREKPSDRLCKCPKPEDGTIIDRIVYCAICQGVIRVIS